MYLDKRNILRYLSEIQDAGIRTSKIVKNMLKFSHNNELIMAPINLNMLLDEALELAAYDYDLKKKYDFKQIRIIRDYDENLPEVPCATTEIEQVFLNLFRNSAQAISAKKASLETPQIRIVTHKEPTSVKITLADNGSGMDETTRKRIFEPFFTSKEVGDGTGLGLSISYFIITELHGGTIEVESTPDGGTTFTIHLPLL
jgi:signal transduction histidine kinase